MADVTPSTVLQLASERAYVVYDRTGRIVHVHQTFVYRGAEGQAEQQEADRAVELARRYGHSVDGLQALRIRPGDLDLRQEQRVDPKTRRLVTPPAPKAGSARRSPRKTSGRRAKAKKA